MTAFECGPDVVSGGRTRFVRCHGHVDRETSPGVNVRLCRVAVDQEYGGPPSCQKIRRVCGKTADDDSKSAGHGCEWNVAYRRSAALTGGCERNPGQQ